MTVTVPLLGIVAILDEAVKVPTTPVIENCVTVNVVFASGSESLVKTFTVIGVSSGVVLLSSFTAIGLSFNAVTLIFKFAFAVPPCPSLIL